MSLVYRENPKQKRGAAGDGPPRWFPDSDSLCPDEITMDMAQQMLATSIPGRDDTHPDRRARYALEGGVFYKGYSEGQTEDGVELWHGYPVRRELVARQIPSRVLRQFVQRGELSRTEYRKLLGGAR